MLTQCAITIIKKDEEKRNQVNVMRYIRLISLQSDMTWECKKGSFNVVLRAEVGKLA